MKMSIPKRGHTLRATFATMSRWIPLLTGLGCMGVVDSTRPPAAEARATAEVSPSAAAGERAPEPSAGAGGASAASLSGFAGARRWGEGGAHHRGGADVGGSASGAGTGGDPATYVGSTTDAGAAAEPGSTTGDTSLNATTDRTSGGTAQARPSYNRSTGFFVVGSKLYDASGNEFRIRGLNHLHWDDQSVGLPKTGANTERWDLDFKQPIATNLALMQRSIDNKLVPMAGNWDGTCDKSSASLSKIVSTWVANASQWNTLEKYLLVNIANEWGPENSVEWRDQYIAAIAALRNAGINATIVVDSGGCGQDDQDVILYGAEVFNSDPQKNVVFDVHIYGGWQEHPDPAQPWFRNINQTFDKLAATGLPILIGEFGPGRDIGPSPTLLTPGEVITAAESHNFGWLAWAWDDPAGEYTNPPRDDWFALSFTGDYNSTADLTTFGKDVIENPVYGLKLLGKPASIF